MCKLRMTHISWHCTSEALGVGGGESLRYSTDPLTFLQVFHKVGVKEEVHCPPTYVYPQEVKMLIRHMFPQDICNYPDPSHGQVSVSDPSLGQVSIHVG